MWDVRCEMWDVRSSHLSGAKTCSERGEYRLKYPASWSCGAESHWPVDFTVCVFTVITQTVVRGWDVDHDWCMTGHSGPLAQSSHPASTDTAGPPPWPKPITPLHHPVASQYYHYQLNILSSSQSFQHNTSSLLTSLSSQPFFKGEKIYK